MRIQPAIWFQPSHRTSRVLLRGQFQRPHPVDVPATLAAVLLTVTSFVAVLIANAPLARVQPVWPSAESKARAERVAFMAPRAEPLPSARADAPVRPSLELPRVRGEATVLPPVPARQPADTTAGQVVTARAATTRMPAPSIIPTVGTPRGLTPAPFTLPRVRNPFLPPTTLSRREEDSARRELGVMLPRLARDRVPTVAERDSLTGVAARGATIPGRPAQMLGGVGGGISVPLFSPGPSPAERRRDSIGNAEYVARLARLQERARLRKDSIRFADSSSKRGVPE